MIKNYFKVAIRNILKYKFYSFINILGMTIGITACLLIIIYVVDELSYDQFHAKADRIYQVGLHGKLAGQDIMTANTCPPLAEALVQEVPGVEEATRISPFHGQVVKNEEKVFTEKKVFFADSNFFSFFSFQILEGDPKTALQQPNSVVLTESMAKKYFNNESAIGKLLVIGNDNVSYIVTGITPDAPTNSHIDYDMLLSSSSSENLKRTEWLSNYLYTYFILSDKTPIASIESKFDALVLKYVGPEIEKFMGKTIKQINEQGGLYGYYTTPIVDIHLHSVSRNDLTPGGDIKYVYFFSAVGLFIIVIACINFMNLSTARSAGRAKEVGLRKTLGSLRGQMIAQFLAESIMYSFIAVVLALAACSLLLPYFNLLSGKELDMQIFLRLPYIAGIVGLIIFVGLIAGSYPAFYLTSFSAVDVLKGKVRAGMKSKGVRSTLVISQFALSTQVDALKIAIDQQAGIVKSSFTNNTFPGVDNETVFKAAGSEQDHMMGLYYADYDHQEVLKFKMIAGRYFSKDFPSDSTAIILNEAAVKEFGFKNPLQEELLFHNEPNAHLKIIGVYKDFNFKSLKEKVTPLAIRLTKNDNQLMIRYAGNPHNAIATIEKTWKKLAVNEPFDYAFLDENFDELFRTEQRMGKIFTVFSGLAIFIACLGLFALSAFTAEQRTKEIGIRKTMGASVLNLTLLLSKEFTKLVVIAFVPAAICAWYVSNQWLLDFEYRITINPMLLVWSGLGAIVIAWLTVSYQAIKTAIANPVDSLRYE